MPRTPGHRPATPPPRARRAAVTALTLAALVLPAATAGAVTDVTTPGGATFTVHDAHRPGLDTGSIRALSRSRIEGFGNVFLRVEGGTRSEEHTSELQSRGHLV